MERITPRSFLILIICTIFLVPGLVAQLDRPFASGLPNSFPQRNFNGQHVGLLNLANRQMRSGRLEEAIMSYNAALAQQPNWVPALVGRAGVLTRVGRHLEAQKDLILANRINPTATDLLFTNNSSELLFFLALYPATEWPAVQGATNSGTLTSSDPNFSYIDYFQSQYDWIAALPDSLIYAPVLRNKVSRDLTQASQILNE
ncbi:MAG: tetratricopeptide repeat protein, partial [Bacteroidota bacterium]